MGRSVRWTAIAIAIVYVRTYQLQFPDNNLRNIGEQWYEVDIKVHC